MVVSETEEEEDHEPKVKPHKVKSAVITNGNGNGIPKAIVT